MTTASWRGRGTAGVLLVGRAAALMRVGGAAAQPGPPKALRERGDLLCSLFEGQRFFFKSFFKIWLSLESNQDHGVISVELLCSRLSRKALMLDLVLLLSTSLGSGTL